jgi:hypothetical protein
MLQAWLNNHGCPKNSYSVVMHLKLTTHTSFAFWHRNGNIPLVPEDRDHNVPTLSPMIFCMGITIDWIVDAAEDHMRKCGDVMIAICGDHDKVSIPLTKSKRRVCAVNFKCNTTDNKVFLTTTTKCNIKCT